jgi:kynurenine formamidase
MSICSCLLILVWMSPAPFGLAVDQLRVVDLSATIRTSPPDVPSRQRTDIAYTDHAAGAREMQERWGIPSSLLRAGEGPALERFEQLVTHNTTHVDAPYHYNSSIQGRPSRTIDEIPLDWFIGPGVVVDATDRADGDAVGVDDLKAGLEGAAHDLCPRDIVLIRTGCDRWYDQPDYPTHGPGVSPEATRWLHDQGVRVMGIDAWGWDAPIDKQAVKAIPAGLTGVVWGAHQIDREYAQIERMVNLGELPPTGFTVVCMPLKVHRGSAGPTRAIALVPTPETT